MKLESVTINCSELDQMKSFYALLGCTFEDVKVTLGSQVARCRLPQMDLKLISTAMNKDRIFPVVQFSFAVGDVTTIYDRVKISQPDAIMIDPFETPDGKALLLKDPQGNSIEVFQPR